MYSPHGAAPRCALLIEPQALFAPYFVAILERSGFAVTTAARRPTIPAVRALAPDVVFVDAAHAPRAPFATIRALRRAAPQAQIVVYVVGEDSLWRAMVRAFGADIVMGEYAGERDLAAAVGSPSS